MRTLHLVGSPPAPSPLIERAAELDALRDRGPRRRWRGRLEAAAGLGKTALLDRAASLAIDAGWLVRRAAPGPLEHHFPFGVVRALLEAPVRESGARWTAPARRRRAAADGYAPGGDSTSRSRTACCGCARRCRAAAAGAGRRRRAVGRPAVAGGAVVPGAAGRGPAAADPRRARRADRCGPAAERCSAPSAAAASRAADAARRRAADRRTRRTPVASRLPPRRRAATRGCWPSSARTHRGATLARSRRRRARVVRRRLAELTPRDRGVVEALAVIGDGAAPHVAGRGRRRAGRRARAGARRAGGRGAARSGRQALRARADRGGDRVDLAPTERERLHREAARALMAAAPTRDGRLAPARVQPAGRPGGQRVPASAAAALGRRPRGRRALSGAGAGGARAGRRPRGDAARRSGTVAFDAGLPDSRRLLHEALPEVRDRDDRVDVLTRLASLNLVQPGDGELVGLFDAELAGETDPDVRLAIEAARSTRC